MSIQPDIASPPPAPAPAPAGTTADQTQTGDTPAVPAKSRTLGEIDGALAGHLKTRADLAAKTAEVDALIADVKAEWQDAKAKFEALFP